jgi:predicted DNA binding CopG/RHH family protein
MKKKIELDRFETDVEAHIDEYVAIKGKKRERIESILERGRKSKNINIRISQYDLANLKRKAEAEGIPYQTLITSILHKYITDKLIDEEDIIKSLKILSQR